MRPYLRTACTLLAVLLLPDLLAGQTTLERSPLLSGGWIATPGSLEIATPFRFDDGDRPDLDVFVVPTFHLALGLPNESLVGGRYAPQSQVMVGESGEWEVFGRRRVLSQPRGAPLDLAVQAGYNGGAESLDAELSAARWLGGLRVLGAARVFTDAYDTGEAGGSLAGGAVWMPRPRSLPIALAGDLAIPVGEGAGGDPAWSVGVQAGVSFTDNTVSLFATNTGSGTLQGVSRGQAGTRLGVELTLPIPLGRFLGWYVPREEAAEAVQEPEAPAPGRVQAEIFRYAYVRDRIEIPAGTTIEWTNRDEVVHTVTADDASFNSGAIPPGESWSATFSRPGTYPFHCGPHPFMKGTVVVR